MKFKKRFQVGDRWIGEGEPCFIVAEAGLNHNGQLDIAKKLVDLAITCNADAVKFQKRSIDDLLTREALEAPYVSWYAYGETYGEHRRSLELSEDEFREIADYARERGIIFFASGWDIKSVDFLETLQVPVYKVASADLTNLPLIEHVAKKGKPMFVSTGMSDMSEVRDAVELISRHNDSLVLMQCTSTYPSGHEELNLNVMETYKREFNCLVGFSGHERGIAVSEAAAALGACVVERHFTLDRTMKGPDHAASLEPTGLYKLVRDIRGVERARGSFEKRIQESEISIRTRLAKSVVSKVPISKGTVITREMLTIKGPGTGLPPRYIYVLPGKRAVKDIPEDSVIKSDMIEY